MEAQYSDNNISDEETAELTACLDDLPDTGYSLTDAEFDLTSNNNSNPGKEDPDSAYA
jgi:hypothetical protein